MRGPAAPGAGRRSTAAAVAAACAGLAAGAALAADVREADEAAARGEALAKAACGSCHALGLAGESNWAGAPAFRDMKIDLNAISYERRMAQMHRGYVRMPPAEISLDEVRDIRAYVRSLRAADKR